jgi:hypothetical protein
METTTLSHIDALIAELKALKANAPLLESKGENIEAQVEQIRAMLKIETITPKRKKAGWAKGFVTYIADDFNAPIDDMAAYS